MRTTHGFAHLCYESGKPDKAPDLVLADAARLASGGALVNKVDRARGY
jgi:hypothetical protein